MAQEPQPQQKFHYKSVQLFKTESLGVGSYGAVCKAMCDDLPCAAKILHPTLFQFTAPETTSVMQNFEQECRLLSAIKHPNIVQYLATYRDPESRLPVLLMELMDESLTRFLERSHEPLPYHTEVNLCHDIALALSYLHSNGIIHRDLSSNNVLLISGSRAKVTDFGMVKLYDVNRSTTHLTPLTLCPGTTVYMSPEALRDRPVYTDKLDSFSFGVLCIQIMTRQFPDPGDRFNFMVISDPRIPSGTVQVEVPEIERRQSHIDLIDPAHPLLAVALDCLKTRGRERPSCHELCGCMLTLKASPKYTESMQLSQVKTVPRQSNRQQAQQIQDLQQQLHTLSDQLHEKEQENQRQRQQIVGNINLLTATIDQVQQKEAAVTTCQQTIQQLRQQLQSSEQITAEFQENILEKEKMIQDQERQIQDQERQIQELQQQLRGDQRQEKVEASDAAASGCSIKLRWRDGGRAPSEMVGEVTAVDGSVAYFRPGGYGARKVFAYNSTSHKWSELPMCPYHMYGFSIAMVNGLLTAIGGKIPNLQVTNSLLSLTDSKWKERFPPMPTKRWFSTTVSSSSSLVVAGGIDERDNDLRTVEVMDTETLQWSTASSLPHPLCSATATLCGDKLYMLGGWVQSGRTKSVFTCSLATLIQSCQPQGGGLKTLSLARRPKVWHQLAGTPYTLSRCVSLQGQLLSVGGRDSDIKREVTAVHMYNTTTNSWEVISHMAIPRSRCLVAVLPHNELMVVGGYTPDGTITDSVEIATIV